ncbi:MAG: hypothetical protein CMO65_05420, partial [Verrucomicrobiales bacterium]|nr:hypothetical protein [Verrucomicrobiales bacterium]
MKQTTLFLTATLLGQALVSGESVTVDSQADWEKAIASSNGVAVANGTVSPNGKTGQLKTKLKRFDRKRSALSLTIRQSPIWQNWIPIENLGPENLRDAPVLLTVGPGNYWMFGRYGNNKPKAKRGEQAKRLVSFTPHEAKLEGFDMPLQTTRFPN